MKIDLHTHTIASGHAFNTLFEMAAAAAQKTIKVLGITDHGPSMEGAAHMGYFEMAGRIPANLFGVRVLFGCEANVIDLDGGIDIPGELQSNLDLIVVGLHKRTPFPQKTTREENTIALINAISRHRIHIIAHPWRPDFPTDIVAISEAAAQRDVCLELNLALLRYIASNGNIPAEISQMLTLAQENKNKIVVSSDAHCATEIGEEPSFLNGLGLHVPDEINLAYCEDVSAITSFLEKR